MVFSDGSERVSSGRVFGDSGDGVFSDGSDRVFGDGGDRVFSDGSDRVSSGRVFGDDGVFSDGGDRVSYVFEHGRPYKSKYLIPLFGCLIAPTQ